MDEMAALLHQSGYADKQFLRNRYAFRIQKRGKESGKFLVCMAYQVLVVKPLRFFGIEAGARFPNTVERKTLNQLLHREDLLFRTRIPSQQRKHVDEAIRQIAVFAVASRNIARFGIFPGQRKDGKTQLVAVTLAQFALSHRFEDQRKV